MIVLACVLSAAAGAVIDRYFARFTIVPLVIGPAAYQYDRWTGETKFLVRGMIFPVYPQQPKFGQYDPWEDSVERPATRAK